MRGPAWAKLRSAALGAGLSAIALAGCAGTKPVPGWASGAAGEDPKFPRSRFLIEAGVSNQSPADAELQAKARLSADVSAQLTAESSSYLQASGSSETQSASVEVKQRTKFERADLIAIIDRADSGSFFYARAALDRARCDAEMGRAEAPDLVSFNQYADSALDAAKNGRPGEFTTASARAASMIPGLDAQFIVRRAVLGHPSEDEQRFLGKRNALLQAQAEAEAHRVIEVRVEGAPQPALLQLAVSAVRKLGLRVGEEQTCDKITEHRAEAAELVLSPTESCGESSLGEKCSVAVRLHARGCQGGGEGEGSVAQQTGIHPSDRERARQSAWKHVTPEVVQSAVDQALQQAQLIGCPGKGC